MGTAWLLCLFCFFRVLCRHCVGLCSARVRWVWASSCLRAMVALHVFARAVPVVVCVNACVRVRACACVCVRVCVCSSITSMASFFLARGIIINPTCACAISATVPFCNNRKHADDGADDGVVRLFTGTSVWLPAWMDMVVLAMHMLLLLSLFC